MTYDSLSISFPQIMTLVYILTTFVVYSNKRKIMTLENYVFTFLCYDLILLLVIDIISILYMSFASDSTLIFINRFYCFFLDIWLLTTSLYITLVVSRRSQGNIDFKENKEKKYFINIVYRFVAIDIVITILNFTLPMAIDPNKRFEAIGPATTLCYVVVVACEIYMLLSVIANAKRIPKKIILAMVLFILIPAIGLTSQFIVPYLSIYSPTAGFITSLIYFTLENPDIGIIEEINIATKSAERANMAKNEFLTNMSNEIRTPLNAIVGFAKALRNEKISDKAKDEVNQIMASSNNLLDIVNDILDISKIESNKMEFAELDYDSAKLFDEIAEKASRLIKEKNIVFKSEIDNKIPPVLHGDKYRIKQIMMNLLSNAVKYTKEGTVSYIVSGETLEDGRCKLTIIVDDTGKGISKEDLTHIFSSFQKIDIVENNEMLGTGLGLAITKDLVELMGGTIRAESELGKGSKFTVVLYQGISNKNLTEIDDNSSDYKPFDASQYRIIVVDDNNINLKVAKQLLKDYNLEPELVNTGEELLTRIENGSSYDLIFLDEVMPKVNGTEVLKELRRKNSFKTPVIALTANQQEGAKESFLQSGFNNYLAKPIIKEQLYIIMRQYLNPNTDVEKEDQGDMVTFEL
jgi:signal transduction histidine kinase/ActR/RegA family two-component response regulator